MQQTLSTPGKQRFSTLALFIIGDVIVISMAYYVALLARFNFSVTIIPEIYLTNFKAALLPMIIIGIVCNYLFRIYHCVWRFASVADLLRVIYSFTAQQILILAYAALMQVYMPRTFWLIGAVIELFAYLVLRFSYRVITYMQESNSCDCPGISSKRVMIIGAGSAGRILVREMRTSDTLPMTPVCFIDDNNYLLHKSIDGVEIVGNRYDIESAARKYKVDEIVFAIPCASEKTRQEILQLAQNTHLKISTLPGIAQIVKGNAQVSLAGLREVSLEDLLGRESVQINNEEIHSFVKDKVVLVTGGGGSIGSELCRQLAADSPKQLIIFDIYENNAYAIQQELLRKLPSLNLKVLIGSVRDVDRVEDVFSTYKPDIVFHAAAHKHVPLMEVSPHEAIKNNVFGTYNVARSALSHHARRFVLISTDKAVNPTNIMGASKRLCEMVVQMMDRKSEALETPSTRFTAVRFGNVLGSNGSVVPLFKQQIKNGGPVTVTHKDIVRYFMTIPEAVGLVLQSSFYACGGEIFILDMGEPVRIDDMARNLIRLSGFEPDVDIPIVYTGLRPGEKLYEEMLMSEEGLHDTENKLIHIGEPISMDDTQFESDLETLYNAAEDEHSDIIAAVKRIVPTYHPELGGISH